MRASSLRLIALARMAGSYSGLFRPYRDLERGDRQA
jgi:hypothetical protein